MDHKKLKTAYHETAHAVMALICGLKIKKVSIKGTDKYRGVMSTEPPERQITNSAEALREVRISLSGFVGEVLTDIENPLVRSYIEGKLSWCHNKLNPYKSIIKLIADRLYESEELSGDEVSALFNSPMQSSLKAKLDKI